MDERIAKINAATATNADTPEGTTAHSMTLSVSKTHGWGIKIGHLGTATVRVGPLGAAATPHPPGREVRQGPVGTSRRRLGGVWSFGGPLRRAAEGGAR
ncbi:hypothetical protein BJ968_000486 [Kineococcus aurantiacus]|uniref:Uncharacterized protein n=1 Tax=Kineococcus aurantiacus TaxID=37633 RepID=A0A7Y9ASU1_9ACTN|nr:hypothetical protein [Kineococcus aurantiacus]